VEGSFCLFNILTRNLPKHSERKEEKVQFVNMSLNEFQTTYLCNRNIDYYHYSNLVGTVCRTGASLNGNHNMLLLGLMFVRLHKMVAQTSRSTLLFRIH
jgi:hypothetical protein